jgi:hypothetical protein
MLVEPHARSALAQGAGQGRFAGLDRLATEICAIQLQEVEGIEESLRLVAAAAQDVEAG